MKPIRTQVAIIGAGPAGLMLSQLLHLEGIDSIVLERQSRHETESALKAGVLEQGTVDLLNEIGAGERMMKEGQRQDSIVLRVEGQDVRIDLAALTGGGAVRSYAQRDVIKDLLRLRRENGGDIRFNANVVNIRDLETDLPKIRYRDRQDEEHEIHCDFIAGSDGTRGVCRRSVPAGVMKGQEQLYPYAWFGILYKAPRVSHELIYAVHRRGFALVSTQSRDLQRLFFQCSPTERIEDWPDDRIWTELQTRLASADGWLPERAPIIDRSVVGMRSLVVEPMQYGRLFLAGDAAHVVPPTGAKGLNLAAADARLLARALTRYYRDGRNDLLETYSTTALQRVRRMAGFAGWMTSLLHRSPDSDEHEYSRQIAALKSRVGGSELAATLAEHYVGRAEN